MLIRQYDPCAGTTIEDACAYMAESAPCEATLNGVYMLSRQGDTAADLLARLRAGMDRNSAEGSAHIKAMGLRVAHERGTCAGEITRALVMLRAGDTDMAERLLVAEIKRLTG